MNVTCWVEKQNKHFLQEAEVSRPLYRQNGPSLMHPDHPSWAVVVVRYPIRVLISYMLSVGVMKLTALTHFFFSPPILNPKNETIVPPRKGASEGTLFHLRRRYRTIHSGGQGS